VFLIQGLNLPIFALPIFTESQIITDCLPLGISFYTFQLISFVVDILRSGNRTSINFIDYINYMVFFPKVISGPIERWPSISAQMKSFRFTFNVTNIDIGLKWICLGFFFKFVLADNLAPFINIKENGNAWTILFSVYLFGLKLYFDFAGYSFIAVGLADIMGIRLTLNFLAPYSSLNIQDFWRRWHISLMSWFRDYLYFPLGGSKRNNVYLNLLIVFVLSGFWHGASTNFLLWGAYHSLLMVFYRFFSRVKPLNVFTGWFVTFNSVMLGWLFFMETNSSRLLAKLSALSSLSSYSISNLHALINGFSIPELSVLLVVLGLSSLVLILESISSTIDKKLAYSWLLRPGIVHSMVFFTMLCSARAFTRFLYFNF
jgi:D-alanyl-lipoteichoic acid acyltransferase DltB (MBOAT superfamily)